MKINDDKIEEVFELFGVGVAAEDIVWTHDTLESFAENHSGRFYQVGGYRSFETTDGLCVIDFGNIRGADGSKIKRD